MIKLTARQEQILALIRDAIENTGFPPTRAEIATEMGFRSANAAEEHLQALARKGAIEISPGTSRGIRLLDRPADGSRRHFGGSLCGRISRHGASLILKIGTPYRPLLAEN